MDCFEEKVKDWDNERRSERARIISSHIASFVQPNCKSAMELGCGTGLISFNLMDLFEKITLIDTSESMLTSLKEKIQKQNINKMVPLKIDLTEDKYDEKFDIIYSSMALHHIIDLEKVIQVIHELLNNKGQVCIVDLDKENGDFHLSDPTFDGHKGFCHEKLRLRFDEVGFSNIKIQTFYHGIKEIGDKQIPYSLFCLTAQK